MSLREKEKSKEQQEKFQAILSALLKDEDNKYCVDCDAKGPRWASWNLGIFLCIRCAGIHRNLGVHISRVKSVNLDTWTGEQVAMMQEVGNSRGRAVYEANIPDGFRRPQSDSALEAFVRAKYEQKKYIAREWIPPKPKVPKEWLEDSKGDKKKARARPTGSSQIQLSGANSRPAEAPARNEAPARVAQRAEVKLPARVPQAVAAPASATSDLLGLAPATPAVPAQAQSSGQELLDVFGISTGAAAAAPNDFTNGSENNLFPEDNGAAEDKKPKSKDSIMALFGGAGAGGMGGAPAGNQQQMYNVPGGMYMPQGQQQGYPGMMGQMPNMMGMQQNPMGAQQQNMMAGQQNMMAAQQPQGMMGYQANMMGQQPHGMMGVPQMNGAQAGMYGNQMMGGAGAGQGMYTPQQMQQYQFQQMQQQMAAMNMGGPAQQVPGAWSGNPAAGQTLSNNLWQ